MGSVLEETFNVNSNERFIWVELETLTELITKGSSPKWQGVDYVEKSKNAVLFITSENVGNHRMLLNNKKYVDATFNKIEPRSILKDGDILMNIVGASIGRTAVYNLTEVANINQAVCLIRLDNSKIDNEYALHFFNSPLCNSYMMDKQVDNARANLSMGSIKKFRIPILTLGDQKKLVMYLNKAHAKQIELANHFTTRLTQLRELKSSILESAFKGEL
jgi:type I restriction enzyme S subunit